MIIRLIENIPTHEGRQFPYLAVEQVIGTFPIATEQANRVAAVQLKITPFRIVQAGGETIRIAHPTATRTLSIQEFSASTLAPLAAGLIAANIAEWATAEAIEVPE